VEADSNSVDGGRREYGRGEWLIKEGNRESDRGNYEVEEGKGGRGTTNPTDPRRNRTIEDGFIGGYRGLNKGSKDQRYAVEGN
jgi:hypothetical protein